MRGAAGSTIFDFISAGDPSRTRSFDFLPYHNMKLLTFPRFYVLLCTTHIMLSYVSLQAIQTVQSTKVGGDICLQTCIQIVTDKQTHVFVTQSHYSKEILTKKPVSKYAYKVSNSGRVSYSNKFLCSLHMQLSPSGVMGCNFIIFTILY